MEYLNEFQVAKIVNVSVRTLRNWRFLRKGVPYCKIGRCVRYDLGDIIEFMQKRKITFEDR